MKNEKEVQILYEWIMAEMSSAVQLKGEKNPKPEPTTFPAPGYCYDARQAIDILKWVLDK